MTVTRHEFLTALHELLKPEVYLETGVQAGISLGLSKASRWSIGIDPYPLPEAYKVCNDKVVIWDRTSDDYFNDKVVCPPDHPKIDFAFIDGMHLAEFAWRDFVNIARYAHRGTVVVFDDVLPYTTDMASREICPGDWTGDVWKVYFQLHTWWNLVPQLVDTLPTGTLVVTGFGNEHQYRDFANFEDEVAALPDVALLELIDRRHAWKAEHVLENLRDRGFAK